MARALVFAATFNEKDNVATLVDRISSVSQEFDILIVDDNSPDGTGELLDRIAAHNPRVKVVHRPAKIGLGTAHHLAMLYATKHGYEQLVTMDADLSHEPEDIPRLLGALAEADFAIGSRYMPGGTCDYSGYRRFVSVAANVAARLLLRIPLHEFTTSFRAFRVRALDQVNFVKMHNQGYSFFMESVYRLNQAGLKLAEVPINFRDRFAGASKIPRLEIVRGMLKLLHLSVSRHLARKMGVPSPHPEDHCANCGSIYMSERFPEDLNSAAEGDRSNAYRCSSMAHARKPRVVKCLECGLSQIPKSDQPPELAELYEEVVDNDYLSNMPAKRRTFARAYERISRFLPKPGRLLEIGSYCGLFLVNAQRRGWTPIGIEPSRWAADYSRRTFGVKVLDGTLERARPEIQGEFDAVVSWDVIEHVPDPKRFLEEAYSLLRSGGVLAVSTIDIDSRFARMMRRHWPWIMEMHLFYFGKGVLEHMFRSAGLEVLRVEPYRHYASLPYIFRKLCGALPSAVSRPLGLFSRAIPNLIVPVSLGDVKLYVGRKV